MIDQARSGNAPPEGRYLEKLQTAVSSVVSFIYFALFVLAAVTTLCALAPLWLLSPILDRDRRILHAGYCRVLYGFMRLNPFWQCPINGLSNLKVEGPVVLVANHQSMADICLMSGLPLNFRWVAKNAIFQIPVISCFMLMDGSVRIRSGSLASTRCMLRDCKRWLSAGMPVLLFPEGTRSTDGKLLPFKDGPFQLAVDCNLPVIPIVINGTSEVWPKYASRLRFTGKMELTVLPAVQPAEFEGSVQRLKTHVESLMGATLAELRRQKPSEASGVDRSNVDQSSVTLPKARRSAKRAAHLN